MACTAAVTNTALKTMLTNNKVPDEKEFIGTSTGADIMHVRNAIKTDAFTYAIIQDHPQYVQAIPLPQQSGRRNRYED